MYLYILYSLLNTNSHLGLSHVSLHITSLYRSRCAKINLREPLIMHLLLFLSSGIQCLSSFMVKLPRIAISCAGGTFRFLAKMSKCLKRKTNFWILMAGLSEILMTKYRK